MRNDYYDEGKDDLFSTFIHNIVSTAIAFVVKMQQL